MIECQITFTVSLSRAILTATLYACLSVYKHTLATNVSICIANTQTGTTVIIMHYLELGGFIIESSNLQSDSFYFQSRWVTTGKVF